MAEIHVKVIEAVNLKKKDLFSDNDPYVEVYLENEQRQKTKVIQNSKNPKWDQVLVLNHLSGQDVLHVNVYDEDRLKDDLIGSTNIDLTDLYEQRRIDQWYTIFSSCRKSDHGQIHLMLEYKPLRV